MNNSFGGFISVTLASDDFVCSACRHLSQEGVFPAELLGPAYFDGCVEQILAL